MSTPARETASVEHLDWRTFMSASADMPEKSIKALDKHFNQFVALKIKDGNVETQECVNCGKPLTGFLVGTFEWGIAHGFGRCSHCHWPAQAHHFIEDDDGQGVATIRNIILQFHPDLVERRSALAESSHG